MAAPPYDRLAVAHSRVRIAAGSGLRHAHGGWTLLSPLWPVVSAIVMAITAFLILLHPSTDDRSSAIVNSLIQQWEDRGRGGHEPVYRRAAMSNYGLV
jgi:hypothetical protein